MFCFFQSSPRTCLHWTLVSAFAKPYFAPVAFASSTGPLACGSVRTFLQPIAVPAETIACDRTRTHTLTLELFSHSALSDQSHDGLPNSSTRLNTSELQVEGFYVVSNDGNAREASCCQRTPCHSRFLHARFCWVDGAKSHSNCSGCLQSFRILFCSFWFLTRFPSAIKTNYQFY